MLDNTIIDGAVNKKYTEFSDAIKAELHSKLGDHEYVAAYTSEYDRIQLLKAKFVEINGTPKE